MSPWEISENLGESRHCKIQKFENFFEVQTENGESRTNIDELQGSLWHQNLLVPITANLSILSFILVQMKLGRTVLDT